MSSLLPDSCSLAAIDAHMGDGSMQYEHTCAYCRQPIAPVTGTLGDDREPDRYGDAPVHRVCRELVARRDGRWCDRCGDVVEESWGVYRRRICTDCLPYEIQAQTQRRKKWLIGT